MKRFWMSTCVAAMLSAIFGLAVQTNDQSWPVTKVGVVPASADDQSLRLEAASGFVFEGCWAYVSGGSCYDVYRDSSGDYWICKTCGTTKNPGKGRCQGISIDRLNRGYWCS